MEGQGSIRDYVHTKVLRKVGVRFPMISLEFFIEIILPTAPWSRGWLSL